MGVIQSKTISQDRTSWVPEDLDLGLGWAFGQELSMLTGRCWGYQPASQTYINAAAATMSSVRHHLLRQKELSQSKIGCLRQLAEGTQYRLRGERRVFKNLQQAVNPVDDVLGTWYGKMPAKEARALRRLAEQRRSRGLATSSSCRDELKWGLPLLPMFESRPEKWRERQE